MPKWPSPKERRQRTAILSDPEVARWIRRLAKGAASTADVWPRHLAAFCVRMKTTPAALLKLESNALVDLLDSYEESESKRGRTGTYVQFRVKVVRSWLRYGNHDLPRGAVKVRDADRVYEETALSPAQLRAVYNAASARERVATALMATSGLRPMVLGNYNGTDGLRLGDLPELKLERGEVKLPEGPLRVVVRQELSKAGHAYFSFLGREGVDFLRTYIETRLRGGEALGPKSAVIVPDRAKVPFIRTTNIGDLLRRALRAAELPNRPYVLRTTFATRLLEAENSGKVAHAWAQFWMGHSGDMTARYTVNRGSLPESTIAEARKAYARCESHLSTAPRNDGSAEIKRLILSQDYSDEEISKMDLDDTEAVFAAIQAKRKGTPPDQRMVEAAQLPALLADGWRFVSAVNGSGAIVQRAG
jgi:integrase